MSHPSPMPPAGDIAPEELSRMARDALQPYYLGRVNNSDIYQIMEGWQREVLLGEKGIAVVRGALDLEAAVQAPDIFTIFVPKSAALTQEVTERILMRNHQAKTVFWEV